jgi:hypothetical protein
MIRDAVVEVALYFLGALYVLVFAVGLFRDWRERVEGERLDLQAARLGLKRKAGETNAELRARMRALVGPELPRRSGR